MVHLHPSHECAQRRSCCWCTSWGRRGLAGPRLDGQAARRAKPRRRRGKLASGTGLLGAAAPARNWQWRPAPIHRACEGGGGSAAARVGRRVASREGHGAWHRWPEGHRGRPTEMTNERVHGGAHRKDDRKRKNNGETVIWR